MSCREHRRFATAAVTALVLAATAVNTAHAGPEGPGDAPPVHIGTFQTRVAPSLTKPDSNEFPPSDLLVQAIEDLEAGRRQSAQRRFEQIVYTSPQSPAAITARQHLAKLYAPPTTSPSSTQSDLQSKGIPTTTPQPRASDDPPPAAKKLASRGRPAMPPTELPAVINQPLSRAMGLAVGDRVFFSPGSVKLGSKARAILRAQAAWLKQRDGLNVVVAAHADEAGTDSENHVLSEGRAVSVRARLVAEGIAADRIRIQALGRKNPIATCAQPICSAQNRRVVTSILRESANQNAPNTRRSRWP